MRLIEKVCGIKPFKVGKIKDFKERILIINGSGSIGGDNIERIRRIFPDSKVTILANPKDFNILRLIPDYSFEDMIAYGEKGGIINGLRDRISKMLLIKRQGYDAIIIFYDKSFNEINKDLLLLFANSSLKIGYIKKDNSLFFLTNRFFIYKSAKAFSLFVFLLALLVLPVTVFWFILILFMGSTCLNLNRVRKKVRLEMISEQDKMNEKGLVSINIVNWNGGRYLGQCIESILNQTYRPIEINIIDNFSTDGSLKYLRDRYPEIRMVENKKNEGFSKAHNQGIRLSRGEYVIPLNFDTILDSKFVEKMVEAVNMSEGIGMVSGKLYKKFEYGISRVIDTTGIVMDEMFSSDRGENSLDNGEYDEYEYIFGASGAAPLYRREMLEDIKTEDEYFDEAFFYNVEDVDLSWRAQLYGWKCIYTPHAIAYHERGATRASDKGLKKEYDTLGYRNRYLAILKNSLPSNIVAHLGRIILVESLFYILQLFKGNYYILKVPIDAIRLSPKILRKRIIIQRHRKMGSKYMETFFFKSLFF